MEAVSISRVASPYLLHCCQTYIRMIEGDTADPQAGGSVLAQRPGLHLGTNVLHLLVVHKVLGVQRQTSTDLLLAARMDAALGAKKGGRNK